MRAPAAPTALALLALLAPFLSAQVVTLPTEVKSPPGMVQIDAKTDCSDVQWLALDDGLKLIPSSLLKDSRTAIGFAVSDGTYRVLAYGAKGGKASPPAVCVVVVGKGKPEPIPDPRPDPKPDPKPDPVIPTGDLYVFLSWERTVPLTAQQQEVLASRELAAYLGKAAKDWRVWEKDVEVNDKVPPPVARAWGLVRDKISVNPAVVVAVGDTITVFQLPATVEETIAQVKKLSGR